MAGDVNGNDIQLSKRNVKTIMREFTDRVSDDAAIRVAYQSEQRIMKKTRAAKMVARQNGRETIKEDDVRLVENIVDEFGGEL
jgi:histone H3/H4